MGCSSLRPTRTRCPSGARYVAAAMDGMAAKGAFSADLLAEVRRHIQDYRKAQPRPRCRAPVRDRTVPAQAAVLRPRRTPRALARKCPARPVLFAMIVLAATQVLLRGVFNSGLAWADEALRLLVLWCRDAGGHCRQPR